MWIGFFRAAFVAIILLYIPGYAMLRLARINRIYAAGLGIFLSLSSLVFITETLAAVRVPLHLFGVVALYMGTTAFLCTAIAMLRCCFGFFKTRQKRSLMLQDANDYVPNSSESADILEEKSSNLVVQIISNLTRFPGVACIAACFIALSVVYLATVQYPSFIRQAWDNLHHVNITRAFLDSHIYSSFRTSAYAADPTINPWVFKGSFYPSLLYTVAALVSKVAHVSVTVSLNAVVGVFSTVVFGGGVALFVSHFISRQAALACALFVGTCSIYPWGFYIFGPLLPNLAGYALIAPLVVLTDVLLNSSCNFRSTVLSLTTWCMSCLCIVLLHPSALCAAIVIGLCYLIQGLCTNRWKYGWLKKVMTRIFAVAVLICAVAAGLFVLSHVPLVAQVQSYSTTDPVSLKEAIRDIACVRYAGDTFICPEQHLLEIFVPLGFITTLVKPRYIWISTSYITACALVVLSRIETTPLSRLVCGFWYNVPYRLSALCCILAVILAGIGLSFMVELGLKIAKQRKVVDRFSYALVPLVVTILFIGYGPLKADYSLGSYQCSLGIMSRYVDEYFNLDKPYSYEKREFMKKVVQLTGKEALLINNPADGSFWAYGITGENIYYRNQYWYGETNEKPQSVLIREHLKDYQTMPEVRDAVQQLKARYVVQLNSEVGPLIDYESMSQKFLGIQQINNETPGFKLLLEEDGNRLYEISDLNISN